MGKLCLLVVIFILSLMGALAVGYRDNRSAIYVEVAGEAGVWVRIKDYDPSHCSKRDGAFCYWVLENGKSEPAILHTESLISLGAVAHFEGHYYSLK